MPARSVTVEKRDAAQRDIAMATAALATRFDIPGPATRIYEGKDPAFNQARELEEIAAFLTRLSASTDVAIGDLAGKAERLTDELEQATQLLDQLHAANTAWAEWGQAVSLLLDEATTNEALRTAMVDCGWLQAEFSETSGWTVSVVGVGADLGELLTENAPLVGDDAPEPPDDSEPDADEQEDSLRSMTRAELNESARQFGIEAPEKLPNKEAVIAAINAKTAAIEGAA